MSHDEEMDAAMSRIGVLRYRLEQAEAELANLKAERDQLKADLVKSDGVVWTVSVENASLKEQVKEKTALIAKLHKDAETSDRESMSDEYDLNHQTKVINGLLRDKEKLQSQVERLTKAGDAMAKLLSCCGNPQSEVRGWHAAKGVQS